MRTGRILIPWAANQGVFLDEAPCWIDIQDNRRRLLVHLGIQRNAIGNWALQKYQKCTLKTILRASPGRERDLPN